MLKHTKKGNIYPKNLKPAKPGKIKTPDSELASSAMCRYQTA